MATIANIPLLGPYAYMADGFVVQTSDDITRLSNVQGMKLASEDAVRWHDPNLWLNEENCGIHSISIEDLQAYGKFTNHNNQQAWKPFEHAMAQHHYAVFSDLWRNLRSSCDRKFLKLGVPRTYQE